MRFVSDDVGSLLAARLSQAERVFIASAFFSPSEALMADLQNLPHLVLIISEEFAVNDPYKLERLKKASLKSVAPDDANGKLHAKVFIAKLKDGSFWALVGSANLTQQGLFANQEACVELSSANEEDRAAVGQIISWFDELYERAHPIDFAAAKSVFDIRSRYRLEQRPKEVPNALVEYWAIKTTSGGAGAEEHWPRLLRESVVAIGWEDLDVDPSLVDDIQLRTSLSRILDPKKPKSVDFGVRTIRNFIKMPVGSIIVLCRGLVPNQAKPVHIYAFARVIGNFRADRHDGTRWRFKRDAVIQEIGAALPASTFADSVGKDSFRQTMHKVSAEVLDRLAENLGVAVEV
jgi:HKD family nuclease